MPKIKQAKTASSGLKLPSTSKKRKKKKETETALTAGVLKKDATQYLAQPIRGVKHICAVEHASGRHFFLVEGGTFLSQVVNR